MIKNLVSIFLAFTAVFFFVDVSIPNEANAAVCPASPDYKLSNFPAHKYELRNKHSRVLDDIAQSVKDLTLSGKPVRKIRIVGYAATWGNKDYKELSENRAVIVESELTSRFADLGVNYDNAKITTEGMGNECPVATDSTQSGRAQNRRVEIWVYAAPKLPPSPSPEKKKTHREHLKILKSSSTNVTIQCLAEKLLSSDTNTSYVPIDGLEEFYAMSIKDAANQGIYAFEIDLRKQMARNLKSIHDVPSYGQTDEKRYKRMFLRAMDLMNDGIRAFPVCYDKRSKVWRAYLISQSKKSNSLYNCPVFKELIEEATKKICRG